MWPQLAFSVTSSAPVPTMLTILFCPPRLGYYRLKMEERFRTVLLVKSRVS